ncbi:50S ribosomal protein L4 [Patescibacteria group bacterium]|nr:50S ribosomal protein L4 [Patescibacteria group bacterium]MBU1966937.1 50S ribosomal protein L4 [Patescibacteria group bacterium]MBU2543715.1 50S ribosomal protein L4 [Patescibacteria group bacterium]
MKLTTYTKTGNKSQTAVTGSDAVFAAKVNQPLLAQGIRVHLANQRQGTSKVKTRSEVARTKKKLYRQKGTGGARHGSKNAPIFVGGGVAHGPTGNANWKLKMTRSLKNQALISALSAQKDQIIVWDGLNELEGKTKLAAKLLYKMVDQKDKTLVVVTKFKPEMLQSLRNIENILLTKVVRLNIYEVALVDKIIMTSEAVKELEDRLIKKTQVQKKVAKKVVEK